MEDNLWLMTTLSCMNFMLESVEAKVKLIKRRRRMSMKRWKWAKQASSPVGPWNSRLAIILIVNQDLSIECKFQRILSRDLLFIVKTIHYMGIVVLNCNQPLCILHTKQYKLQFQNPSSLKSIAFGIDWTICIIIIIMYFQFSN